VLISGDHARDQSRFDHTSHAVDVDVNSFEIEAYNQRRKCSLEGGVAHICNSPPPRLPDMRLRTCFFVYFLVSGHRYLGVGVTHQDDGKAVSRTLLLPFWWRYFRGLQKQIRDQGRGSGGPFLASQTLIFAV